MAKSGSECLADTLSVEKAPARAYPESPRLVEHRNGVPIKRNQRLRLELPVFVYSRSTDQEPLHEMARSLVVYANGGVLVLGVTVKLGQELLLVNPRSEAQAACRIAAFEPCPPVVRLEFTQPVPGFWGVAFPSEDGHPPNASCLGCLAVFDELNVPCPYKFAKLRSQQVKLGMCASRRIFRGMASISRVGFSATARACVSQSVS
jgi:hypothetical protein